MPEMTKPLFITLIINLFLVIGGFNVFDAGIVEDFVQINNGDEVGQISQDINRTLPSQDSFLQDVPGGGTLSQFFDSLGLVKEFITFAVNIAIAPIQLIASQGMPNIVRVFIGVPLLFFNIFGVVSFVRSGN
jgi:hypothetical protein